MARGDAARPDRGSAVGRGQGVALREVVHGPHVSWPQPRWSLPRHLPPAPPDSGTRVYTARGRAGVWVQFCGEDTFCRSTDLAICTHGDVMSCHVRGKVQPRRCHRRSLTIGRRRVFKRVQRLFKSTSITCLFYSPVSRIQHHFIPTHTDNTTYPPSIRQQ